MTVLLRALPWLCLGLFTTPALAAEGPMVEIVPVRQMEVRDELITFGSLRSDESVMIRPEVEGRLATLHFREGQAVTAGDLLISLDDAIARAEFAQARANLDLAEKNHQRAQMLFQRGASNAQALDEAQSQLQASVGDYLSAGQNIVNLEVLDPLKVDFRIPQKAVAQVRLGQTVEITLDTYPGERFRGEIYAINPRLDEAGRSQAIRAHIGNDDRRLRPGQFVRVSVILEERPNALVIPEEAVMPQGDKLLVNLVVDGQVERREVTLGKRFDGLVEVREGLQGDETIISAGWQRVREGLAVRTKSGERQP